MAADPVPRIALTPGEPGGVGPDLCVALAQTGHPAELVAVADPEALRARAALLGLELELTELDPGRPPAAQRPGCLRLVPVRSPRPVTPGRGDPGNSPYVLETLRTAVRGCLNARFDALVTGPVHKALINEAGIAFQGHTELLAELSGRRRTVMMLVAPGGLRVALATTHLPLREVPGALTRAGLTEVLRILDADLRSRFGIGRPRVLVCGLNPHAGEAGHLGREEIEVIAPVVRELRAAGLALEGPLPADTAFTRSRLKDADAVLAMYHDQGLPTLKYAAFGRAVNVTLGLPFIRTSVDHGTAFELAGTGRADSGSLSAALDLALDLVARVRGAPS